jgi:ubiquinone/menaquinone biosynthesis C-methylase UbiE
MLLLSHTARADSAMRFYQRRVLPLLLDLSMRQSRFLPYRLRTISAARGLVLEIGVGSGLNLPLYGSAVACVHAIDPSAELLARTKLRMGKVSCPVLLTRASAEQLPFPSGSVDTVVITWSLCSIPDATKALSEMRRVLKPGGRLLFAEHGLSPEKRIERWQHRLTPLSKRIGGGCHLNRKMDDLIRSAGFDIGELSTGYMKGPKPMTFMYEGSAAAARPAPPK